jgi:hypothetical protein
MISSRKIFNFFYVLAILLSIGSLLAYDTNYEMPIENRDFLTDFDSGILGAGVDCEHIKFLPEGKFEYKFTGDCKGWGRTLKGTWRKAGNQLRLSGNLIESKDEGKIGCAGSYYQENTAKEKSTCLAKYRQKIMQKFGVFPAKFQISGTVWITEKLTAAVKIESYLMNNPKKGKIKGLMHFNDEKFGLFYGLGP